MEVLRYELLIYRVMDLSKRVLIAKVFLKSMSLKTGAFLIPYYIMLFAEGIPLFLVELGIGQKLRLGSVGVWNRIHPRLGGLGISSTMVSFLVSLYYNVIITWCLYYLLKSLTSDLPWAHCPEYPVDHNGTIREVPVHECAVSSATSYFWYREALEISPSIEESGGIKWWMTLCLIGAWIICYLCVMRGIQSTGKVVYFTAMFPYVVLVIFFGRAVTLRGAGIGIAHMFIPKMERLADPNVWLEAGTQIFYSLGLGFGGLIAFSSYNDPKNNCKRDAVLVSLCNCMTSIFASFVIFAVIGYKATSKHDKCIESNIMVLLDNFPNLYNESTLTRDNYMDLIASNSTGLTGVSWLQDCNLAEELNNAAEGTGLAFIVFTQVMVELPGGPFWAVIFFLMLMTLGLGSMFGMLEGMATTMFDLKLVSRVRKEFITGIICLVCMIIGLIFMQGSGEYYLQLFDSFCGTLTLMFIAFCEMIAVMYVYGHERFTHDIKTMCGSAPGKYWQYTWRFIAPVILLGVFISSLIYRVFKPLQYKAWNKELGKTESKDYPGWAVGIGVMLVLIGCLPTIIVLLLRLFHVRRLETDIPQSFKRINTTASTTAMMENDENGTSCGEEIGNGDFPHIDEDIDEDDNSSSLQPPNNFSMHVISMD